MQEDWCTLYNVTTLSIWIEYMINHTKENEQSIVQICSDVWRILWEWDKLEKERLKKVKKGEFWLPEDEVKAEDLVEIPDWGTVEIEGEWVDKTKEGKQEVVVIVKVWKKVVKLVVMVEVVNGKMKVIWEEWEDNKQPNGKRVLSEEEEKQYIENLIKKKFWRKWKAIKVEIVSGKYPKLFDALEKRAWIKNFEESDLKEWKKLKHPYERPKLEDLKPEVTIIPNEEPKLEKMIPFEWPLPIIQYLAYHAKNDEDKRLIELFYNTKPSKYIWNDRREWNEPWEQYFDFYWLVEVWLRLYEVLEWISIQWWMWRQRVYDKIISLIINWEDLIKWKKDFDYKKLYLKDYPVLQELHNKICRNEKYSKTKFNRLYIELSGWEDWGIKETERKLERTSKLKSKIKSWWYGIMIALALCGETSAYTYKIIKDRKEQAQEKFEKERLDMWRDWSKEVRWDDLPNLCTVEWTAEYEDEQSKILMSEYNISCQNRLVHSYDDDFVITENDIVDMYRNAFFIRSMGNRKNWRILVKHDIDLEGLTDEEWQQLTWYLSAENFMDEYWWLIVENYHIPHQKPYEHLKPYQNAIENTIKYWNSIDISKYKTKEKSTKSELYYFIKCDYSQRKDNPNWLYRLKIVTVYLDDWNTIDVVLAEKTDSFSVKDKKQPSNFNLKDWVDCMTNLANHYGYVLENNSE